MCARSSPIVTVMLNIKIYYGNDILTLCLSHYFLIQTFVNCDDRRTTFSSNEFRQLVNSVYKNTFNTYI